MCDTLLHLYISIHFCRICSSFYLVILSFLFPFLLRAAVIVCDEKPSRIVVADSSQYWCNTAVRVRPVANSNSWLATKGWARWPAPVNCYDWRHNKNGISTTRSTACGGGTAAAGSWGRSAWRRARVTAAGESAATCTNPTSQAFQAL